MRYAVSFCSVLLFTSYIRSGLARLTLAKAFSSISMPSLYIEIRPLANWFVKYTPIDRSHIYAGSEVLVSLMRMQTVPSSI